MLEEKAVLGKRRWYYNIEVEKGVFTPGVDRPSFALIRKLLRNADVRGKDCLDLGTMEGAIPVLLKRAGAKSVVAYDRFIESPRWIPEIKKLYESDFDFVGGLRLEDLGSRLDQNFGSHFFDLVVFSGVLYHLINPMGYLGLARSFCKIGGLFLFETRVQQDPRELLIFNSEAKLGKGNTYYIASTAWVDYALRMLGLMPLYAIYLNRFQDTKSSRLAVLCRSQVEPCPLNPKDEWMSEPRHKPAFTSELFVNWDELNKTSSDIKVSPYDKQVVDLKGKSLYQALNKHKPYQFPKEDARLFLNSKM